MEEKEAHPNLIELQHEVFNLLLGHWILLQAGNTEQAQTVTIEADSGNKKDTGTPSGLVWDLISRSLLVSVAVMV